MFIGDGKLGATPAVVVSWKFDYPIKEAWRKPNEEWDATPHEYWDTVCITTHVISGQAKIGSSCLLFWFLKYTT